MSFSPTPHPLPEPLIELVAQRFRVLGEPMRIRLLDQLREGDATVGELQQALGASQQNVSKHLAIQGQRQGRCVRNEVHSSAWRRPSQFESSAPGSASY